MVREVFKVRQKELNFNTFFSYFLLFPQCNLLVCAFDQWDEQSFLGQILYQFKVILSPLRRLHGFKYLQSIISEFCRGGDRPSSQANIETWSKHQERDQRPEPLQTLLYTKLLSNLTNPRIDNLRVYWQNRYNYCFSGQCYLLSCWCCDTPPHSYIYLICTSYDIFAGHKNTRVFTFIFPYNCESEDQQKVQMDKEDNKDKMVLHEDKVSLTITDGRNTTRHNWRKKIVFVIFFIMLQFNLRAILNYFQFLISEFENFTQLEILFLKLYKFLHGDKVFSRVPVVFYLDLRSVI